MIWLKVKVKKKPKLPEVSLNDPEKASADIGSDNNSEAQCEAKKAVINKTTVEDQSSSDDDDFWAETVDPSMLSNYEGEAKSDPLENHKKIVLNNLNTSRETVQSMAQQLETTEDPSVRYLIQEQLAEAQKDCDAFEKRYKELEDLSSGK